MSAPALTPEFCERGYNNRAAVPDHADYFRRWAAESAQVRSTLDCRLDLRYGPGPRQTLDLFPAGGKRGLLMFIHGGYWRSLDKSDHSFVARAYVAAGFDVVLINYDLCPAVAIGAIVDESREALSWLAQNGAVHGVAARDIVIGGHSAGGHLAAMLLATDWRARGVDPGVIRGGVSVGGVFDLEPLIHTYLNPDLKLDVARAAALSPFRMQPSVAAPLLLAVGADETSEFLRQSQLQWDAWPQSRPAGSTGPLQIPGRHHFSAVDAFADPAAPLFRQTVGLFGQ